MKQHHYKTTLNWTGNKGTGTSDYKAYERAHTISAEGKPDILGSSDPSFRGDPSRYSPEDSLVGALSACHMLWYLHLCAVNKVIVIDYKDEASGTMTENNDGSGEFTEVVLKPLVTVKEQSMITKANELHHEANKMCFLARSMKFPVKHEPRAIIINLVQGIKSITNHRLPTHPDLTLLDHPLSSEKRGEDFTK